MSEPLKMVAQQATKIRRLEQEKRAVEEMLYLVLEEIGEPVQIEAEKMREVVTRDRMLDVTLDADGVYWTFRTVEVPNG